MTRVRWQNNNHEGLILRNGIEKANQLLQASDDPMVVASLLNAISGASRTKAGIAKDTELEKRIEQLEAIAGIAAKQVITK